MRSCCRRSSPDRSSLTLCPGTRQRSRKSATAWQAIRNRNTRRNQALRLTGVIPAGYGQRVARSAYNRASRREMKPMSFLFDAPAIPALSVQGSDARFPVHRIYCIGRNYADHAKEMGAQAVSRANPVFFMKPADAVVADGREVPYPSVTQELHHEVEMVVALARGGRDIDAARALDGVFGYGVGLDLTRRDLQAAMKEIGRASCRERAEVTVGAGT